MQNAGIGIAAPGRFVTCALGAGCIGERADLDAEQTACRGDPSADLRGDGLGAIARGKGADLDDIARPGRRGLDRSGAR